MKSFCIFVFLLLLVSFSCVAVCHGTGEGDAATAVAEARQRVAVCYNETVDAAKAGANVTGLLSTLDDSGSLLSNAELALANRDFNSSQALALQSQQVLVGFDAKAAGLKQTAEHDGFVSFMVNIVGSLVGAAVVVVCAFLVWFRVRKRIE